MTTVFLPPRCRPQHPPTPCRTARDTRGSSDLWPRRPAWYQPGLPWWPTLDGRGSLLYMKVLSCLWLWVLERYFRSIYCNSALDECALWTTHGQRVSLWISPIVLYAPLWVSPISYMHKYEYPPMLFMHNYEYPPMLFYAQLWVYPSILYLPLRLSADVLQGPLWESSNVLYMIPMSYVYHYENLPMFYIYLIPMSYVYLYDNPPMSYLYVIPMSYVYHNDNPPNVLYVCDPNVLCVPLW